MHPIDTIKAKLQVQKRSLKVPEKGSIILKIAQETVAKEGLGGLYRGFAVGIVGAVPASFLYFGSYEWFKKNSL